MTTCQGLKAKPVGMTLIEMLVATAITLIMMGLVAQLFGVFGEGVSAGRSTIELTDQMRAVSWRLRQDLLGITVTPIPPVRPEAEQGYLEIIEGPASDISATLNPIAGQSPLDGDCDDILMFTTRSPGAQFIGRFGTGTLESPTAEVAWFCKRSPQQLAGGPTLYTLYRRQLLVTAYVGAGAFQANGNALPWNAPTVAESWQTFYSSYDLSCRLDRGLNALLPNSLGDLTKRENRFLHNPSGITNPQSFPYSVAGSSSTQLFLNDATLTNAREGEDVILSNVIAFDVRVFDAEAPLRQSSAGATTPGDFGFGSVSGPVVAQGAYVDLKWGTASNPLPFSAAFPPAGSTAFQGLGVSVRAGGGVATLGMPTYDTWSTHYEANGIDEDGDGEPDEGTNGFDDDDDSLVDEPDEQETSPPYPVPLRGMEVRIRCYEPSSRQVRQVTVRHTFVPH